MKYSQRWLGFWILVSAIGVDLALLQWSWLSVVEGFVATEAAMTFFMVAAAELPDDVRQPWALTWRLAASVGAEVAAGSVAFVAVANASKAFAVCLLAAACVSSPWLVGRLLQGSRSSDRPPMHPDASRPQPYEPAVAPLPKVELRAMTTTDLCRAWRRSFLLLGLATSVHERSRIVGCRQLYLDELERRSPGGLRDWLASGARAAGSPEGYVADDSDGRHSDLA